MASSQFSSDSIVTDSVVTFLEKIPPFQFLPVAEIRALARHMTLEYFPRDTVILSAGHRASEALYVVQKGGVKLALRTQVGKELILDMRSEGEIFGVLSLMNRDITRLDATALEDTLCYSIPAEDVHSLIERHHEVGDYLFRTSVTRYMDRSLNELRAQTSLMGNSEQLLYSLSVCDVVGNHPIVCDEKTTIRDAAQVLAEAGASALFVAGADKRAIGIATDNDFTQKVVARQIPLDLPVTAIMSTPVISVESRHLVFQALLAMLTHDIHHLLVTEDGIPKGVLTSHDLLLLQGKSPLSLARHLGQQKNLDDLARAQKQIGDLLPLLMREGARTSHITRVVAELNDRLMSKVLELAEEHVGSPPVPYCWVVFGSEGRREQTFKTDQDNGLILADAAEDDPGAKLYFSELASFVRRALERCGYPPCTGDYMASNPRWRQPLIVWKRYFASWIESGELRQAQDALIVFDMRPVGGDFSLFRDLAKHNRDRLKDAGLFKSILAFITNDQRPPLGFFRTFVFDRTGEHKEQLDLKTLGTGPIVNAARLFALDAGSELTNTIDRLAAAQSLTDEERTLFKEVRETFEFLTLLRLENQLRQARAGEPLSNFIAPKNLSHLQRNMLKEAFHTITRLQSVIDRRFRTAVWSQLGQ